MAAKVGSSVAVDLVAEGEVRGQPSRQVGTHELAGRPGAKHRAVADELEPGIAARVGVVGLGQPPDVVIAADRAAAVPVADPDLVVERTGGVVPHLVQPVQPELGLGFEVAVGLGQLHRVSPHRRQQHRLGVAGRVHQLDVVARVEPPAGDIVGSAERRRVAGQRVIAIDGRAVHRRVGVVGVCRLAVEHRPDHVGPVPLGLIEPHRVSQERRVQQRVAGDPKPRRQRPRRAGDDDVGPADGPGCAEIDRAREPVATAPRRQRRAHPPAQDRAAVGVHDRKAGARLGNHRQQHRPFGVAGAVADLVDSHHGAGCGGGRGGLFGGAGEGRHDRC